MGRACCGGALGFKLKKQLRLCLYTLAALYPLYLLYVYHASLFVACAWRAAARAALFKFVRGRVVAGCLLAHAHLSKSEHEGLRCLFGADRARVC